ncbi:MAG: LLM class flavin-dependent oxidoreductase [Actinobacteria bacterium]|nr:MAG: LLM class flavin-dependent oxidoreductase [Actinomycetota bacterium]
MTTWSLRYDLRAPSFGPPAPELYAAALEQSTWADERGCSGITFSEHHGAEDGYLPSPIVMAGAAAARTKHARIAISALIVPFHDQLRLAEDLAVVDLISNGRLTVTIGAGYAIHEFAMFDIALADRARLVEETVATLRQAWTGAPFEFRGRNVLVTPKPVQPGGPPILLGGSTTGAAKRAARIADGFIPTAPKFMKVYLDELARLGKPVPASGSAGGPLFLHVADEPDAAWAQIAPHALHETNSYGAWARGSTAAPYQPATDADELRRRGMYVVVTPDECVELARRLGPDANLTFHPLMGGLDPKLGWQSLELFVDRVLPQLS